MNPRIGQGMDTHAFSDGGTLRLGGVDLPEGPGLAGHSDADVVLHALVDALLGAVGHGDIGALFGSDDPAMAGADSAVFVAGALRQVEAAGYTLGNCDLTVIAQRPRIGPHRAAIRDSVAALLAVPADAVNVKATTTDHLGAIGRGQGIACLAVVLLAPA